MSSASMGSAAHSSEASATSSCHQRSRPGFMEICAASPTRRTTTTFSMVGVPVSASSTLALSGTTVPRRQAPSR